MNLGDMPVTFQELLDGEWFESLQGPAGYVLEKGYFKERFGNCRVVVLPSSRSPLPFVSGAGLFCFSNELVKRVPKGKFVPEEVIE